MNLVNNVQYSLHLLEHLWPFQFSNVDPAIKQVEWSCDVVA